MIHKKSEIDDIEERFNLLVRYITELSLTELPDLAKSMKCKSDDVIDAIYLAVSSNISAQGME
ncbi:MAG: hypothetical protein ACERKZ_16730 [Lachnotalea sp.]